MQSRQAVLALALAAAASTALVRADDEQVARGKKVYEENRCSMCHSIAGKGNPKGPHDGIGDKLTPAEIKEWVTKPKEMAQKAKATRKPEMPKFELKAEEVDALVAYLSTLKAPKK